TRTGAIIGTPHYMSPEQALGERNLDARTDVYALGCVLYEMLTGEPPFSGPTAQAIIAMVMSSEPEPVTALRKAVPAHVAGAIQRALEKLPADRYGSAAEFANGLADSTVAFRTAVGGKAVSGAAGPWRVVALAAGLVAVAAVGWGLSRSSGDGGPTEYDVGLPDSAAMGGSWISPFSISPAGDFVVYEVAREGGSALWYRSLLDATARRIDGSENAHQPKISPDGTRIAFLRGTETSWNVELMPVGGGRATVLAQGSSWANMEWLPDGRILLVEGDGTRARWLDPAGGAPVSRRIRYCILSTGLPDSELLLCGGGGSKTAYRIDPRDSVSALPLWTASPDSTTVVGSHFRVVEGRYLTFVSVGGDLLAAPVDFATGRVGRPVRMLSGLDRLAYWGEATYEVSPSGTLVYATGEDHAIGHLVRTSGQALDTLPLGREAFLRFSVSPDGRRLAAVVEVLDGEQLRIYDLATGAHQVLWRGLNIRQPVWSPGGDEVLIQVRDSLFVGSPDAA
ncbi:MAG: PD40 domain-containing protein, partial [Gemmatimonadales bacterium]|nr:PD40 domain-containing protein [Gemmatimonadales bacterium]